MHGTAVRVFIADADPAELLDKMFSQPDYTLSRPPAKHNAAKSAQNNGEKACGMTVLYVKQPKIGKLLAIDTSTLQLK